jgi:MFS family permease
MEITECPHCDTRVVFTRDGFCPSCRKSVAAVPLVASLVQTEVAKSQPINPYAAPQSQTTLPQETISVDHGMSVSQWVFTILSLIFAVLILGGMMSLLFLIMPNADPESRKIYYIPIVLEIFMIGFLGLGAIANLATGRLVMWVTALMIVGYTISCWLIPMAIWGFRELLAEHKKQAVIRATRANPTPVA